jgi:alpha-1,3-rhamnosyl/mannosyltransferase
MRTIYIEGLGLVDGHFSGIGQYILGTLRGIDEILEQKKRAGEKTPTVKVIIPYDEMKKFRSFGFKHIGVKRFPLPFRIMAGLHHRNKLPPIDLWCGRGFYLFTRFASMPLAMSDYAVIVYDISFETFRQYSDEGNAIFLSGRTKSAIADAKKVITISKNAKQEIIDHYKVPAKKIAVATPAADQRTFYRRSKAEIERAKAKYGIKGEYILSLSNLEPRKNLDGLVDAYCMLPEETRASTGLLLVGVNGWKIEDLFQKIIGKVQEGYNIMRPSKYVHDDDKPAIIAGAKALVYPSHYEGFGMPPLEALACGTPVVCSDNSSLPEVVGDCAEMVKSTDTVAIKNAIQRVINNPKASENLTQRGPKQAEKFNWEKSAKTFFEIFEEYA